MNIIPQSQHKDANSLPSAILTSPLHKHIGIVSEGSMTFLKSCPSLVSDINRKRNYGKILLIIANTE